MNPSYNDVKAGLVPIVAAAAPQAKVHGRVRWFEDIARFREITTGADGRLHVWYVTTATPADTPRLTGPTVRRRVYRYDIIGYLASRDGDGTENIMSAECTAILDALIGQPGRRIPDISGVIGLGLDEDGGISVVENGGGESGYRMYGAGENGVLCHYARVSVPVRVQVT